MDEMVASGHVANGKEPSPKVKSINMIIHGNFSHFRYPESKLARMFNGSIPIILDSLKQHYFIDRDGKMFRHVLNFLRLGQLSLPDAFSEWELLVEEARFYDIPAMAKGVEQMRRERRELQQERASGGAANSSTMATIGSSTGSNGENGFIDCVAIHISPDLGERISLSADRTLLEEVFPELNSALMDGRNSGWNMDNRYVIRFPLNGFCKLNSVQVFQRFLNHGFKIVASNGGGVEGQQFSEYLFCKKTNQFP